MITNDHHTKQRRLVRLMQELDYTETATYRQAYRELVLFDEEWKRLNS